MNSLFESTLKLYKLLAVEIIEIEETESSILFINK